MPIVIKKNLYAKNEEIETATNQCQSYKNILYFNDSEELYNSYFRHINIDNLNINNLKFYNEIYNTTDTLFVFFMDIDIDKETYDKDYENISDSDDYENKEYDIHKVLSTIIQKFINYFIKYNEKLISIQESNEKELSFIDTVTFKKNVLKNIYITKSKNFNKYSFHIYFSNLLINIDCIANIKSIINSYKKSINNSFIKYIDDHVYKKNLSLRLIYCKKDEKDVFYHYPIKCIYKKNNLEIIDEEQELNLELFQKHLFTYNKDLNNYFIVNNYVSEEENNFNIISSIKNIDILESSINNPYLYFLTLKDVYSLIFNVNQETELDYKNNLKNIEYFKSNEKIVNIKNKIFLDFDYTNYKCIFCNNKSHKNIHVVHIGNNGINIIKEGRSYNCKIRTIPYKPLNDFQICEFIYKKNLVKHLSNDELIVFNKNKGWVVIKDLKNNYSELKFLLINNKHYFKSYDFKSIYRMSETRLKENFKCLIKNDLKPVDTNHPYLFKFLNGIYDIKNDKFIKIENSNELYVINNVDYEYKDEKDYTEEEKIKQEFIESVVDQIMPHKINNIVNENREIFEINVSSCLLMCHKDVITIFQGETCAGKTTIKNLILSTVGRHNYIEIPISTYTTIVDPSKPNPWLGSIENKRVSFASESGYVDKLNSQTVKLLTEPKIISRNMYSSETGQHNVLTQIIDTNHNLFFDNHDPASYRRLAFVKFTSFFKKKENENLLLAFGDKSEIKNNFEQKSNLSDDILKNKYSLQFFNLLKKWVQKYHLEKISLKNTSISSDFCILNKAILNTSLIGYNFDSKYIKSNIKSEYTLVKFQKSFYSEIETIVCNISHFKKYFNNFINNKKLNINLNLIINKIQFERKGKKFIPLILIKDIKENLLEEAINVYNLNKKKFSALISNVEDINLNYYNENKNYFKNFSRNDESDEEEDEEEDKLINDLFNN